MEVQFVHQLKDFLGSEGLKFIFLARERFIEKVSLSNKEFI